MGELRPGALTGPLEKAKMQGVLRSAEALRVLGLRIDALAKMHVGEGGAHSAGTPSPATPGGGPATVSGQLKRSITTEEKKIAEGVEIRIGPANSTRSPYRRKGTGGKKGVRRQSSNADVGKALETGLRNGAKYPWLKPSFDQGIQGHTAVFRTSFNKSWG